MKIKYKILIVCMAVISLFAVGCGNDVGQFFEELKCAHDYGDTPTHVVKQATCAEEGAEVWTCVKCKKEKEISVDKLPHTEVVSGAIAATSALAGKTEGKRCAKCNEVIVAQKEVPRVKFYMNDITWAFKYSKEGELESFGVVYSMDILDYEKVKAQGGVVYIVNAYYDSNIAPISAETLFGENAVYVQYQDYQGEAGKVSCDIIPEEKLGHSGESFVCLMTVPFTGSLSLSSLTSKRIARGYIKVGNEYVFADFEYDYANCAISVYELAQNAIASGTLTETEELALQTKIIDVVENNVPNSSTPGEYLPV